MKRLLPYCGLALIAACTSNAPLAPVSRAPARAFDDAGRDVPRLTQPTPSAEAGNFMVRLRRGACLGRCPVYELTIHDDGSVDYAGRSHVAVSGARHGRADPEQLAALRARLAQPETAALAGEYLRGKPICGLWASDQPVVRLDVVLGGRRWQVAHDWGCSGAPDALKNLEQAVDDAAGSSQWVGGPVR